MIHMWWHESPPGWVISSHKAWQSITNLEVKLWIGTKFLSEIEEIVAKVKVVPEDEILLYSNVIRWILLKNYGGIWVDCDTNPLLDPEPLISDKPFISFTSKAEVIPFVVGGPFSAEVWDVILSKIPGRSGRSFQIAGAGLLREIGYYWWDVSEPGRFLSHNSGGIEVPFPSDGIRYCTHDWKTRSQRIKH